MGSTSSVLRIERDGHVATLWLDNPTRRNAMGPAFWEELPRCMRELSDDDDVRAVVIAAQGPHFTTGLDLTAFGTIAGSGGDDASDALRHRQTFATIQRLQGAISSVAECRQPVIAAVHGYCLGGGVDLITACDVRLAAADAVFSVRETRIAIVADVGTLQRLPGIIGWGHVAELALTGKDISAARARDIGLVNDVLPDAAAAISAARGIAAEIAANSPLAVQGTKAILRAARQRTIDDGLERVALWNSAFLQSSDLMEAMAAFVEKRPPRFTGR